MTKNFWRLVKGDPANLKGEVFLFGKFIEPEEKTLAAFASYDLKDLQHVLTPSNPHNTDTLRQKTEEKKSINGVNFNFRFLDYNLCKDSKKFSLTDIIDCGESPIDTDCRSNLLSSSIDYVLTYREQVIQKKVDFVNQRIVEEEFSKYLKIQELTKGQREKYALLIHLFDQFIGACVSGKRIDENYGDQILERLYSKHSNDSYQESIQRIVRRILYTPFTEKTLDIISEEVIQICKQKIKNPWENN